MKPVRMLLPLILLLPLVWVAGCLPDPLAVTGLPALKPQIVVSSQIIPDQSLVILLTKTFGALDASGDSDPQALLEQIAVSDATVTVTGPDGTYTLHSVGLGLYGGVAIPFEEGKSYELHVTSETLGEVSAVTTVKRKVSFETISANLYYNGYDDTLAQVTYSFRDSAERNWYMLNTQPIRLGEIQDNLLDPRSFTRLLSDTTFNGTDFAETFRGFRDDYRTGDTLAVSLANISEDYYTFMKLRLDNRYTVSQFISEPVNYPSNVNGGKGFFNLYVPDVRFFILH
jgi:hypothetical protein